MNYLFSHVSNPSKIEQKSFIKTKKEYIFAKRNVISVMQKGEKMIKLYEHNENLTHLTKLS